MELLTEYVDLCRTIGGMTDWVQGGGGNISIKESDTLLLKESGVRIGDTTNTEGFVFMSICKLQELMSNNIEDCSTAISDGCGRPSIEAFFHTVPNKYVVHLHPSHLLNTLCEQNATYVPYVKPGLTLAKEFFKLYNTHSHLYYLQNHGIIITTDYYEQIFEIMNTMRGWTDIQLSLKLFNIYKTSFTVIPPIVKSFQYVPPSYIHPLTPDIVVFLKQPLFTSIDRLADDLSLYLDKYKVLPNIVCDGKTSYIIANSIGKCYDIFEILMAVKSVEITPRMNMLSKELEYELTNWDKEKHRLSK